MVMVVARVRHYCCHGHHHGPSPGGRHAFIVVYIRAVGLVTSSPRHRRRRCRRLNKRFTESGDVHQKFYWKKFPANQFKISCENFLRRCRRYQKFSSPD